MKGTILIIDDEDPFRGLLVRLLNLEGYTIFEAATGRGGLKMLERETIQLVICDVQLPDGSGIDLSAHIRRSYPSTEIIILTAYGTIADGVTAIKNGAFDYLIKSDDTEKISPLVNRAVAKANEQFRARELAQHLKQRVGFDRIIGKSRVIRRVIDLAGKVAVTDTTVLLTGETGTGKDVLAQAIHQASPRRAGPFVAINCVALGREILESELFGHREGSFTGASRDQKGLFAEAENGTLFLDEIGEMPLELQAKLLRVLETREFLAVGDTRPTPLNVRVIAATNRNLEQAAQTDLFRRDLFYRLSAFSIELPALRERPGDIALLAEHFVWHDAAKAGRRPPQLSPEFISLLQRQHWTGNIRELKNIIERAIILADGPVLLPEHLPYDMLLDLNQPDASTFNLIALERAQIRRALQHTGGNKAETARLLGIGLTTLYRKLAEIRRSANRSREAG